MPEYLAPGVYVEEVDTGSKPIEGVSTSTSGMVGVTAWGPENVATLVTGFADFQRQFGGYLDYRKYIPDRWYLPHAVEGFFTNGGKRLYIVRVLPEKAEFAKTLLFDRGNPTDAIRRLAVNALKGHKLLLLESDASTLKDKYLRINDGELSEYVQALDPPTTTATAGVRALRAPLYFSHLSKTKVQEVTAPDSTGTGALTTTLKSKTSPGELRISLNSRANVIANSVLRIDVASNKNKEFAVVASVPADPNDTSVTLRNPLVFEHIATAEVKLVTPSSPTNLDELAQAAKAGSGILFLKNPNTNWGDSTDRIIQIGENTDSDREYHVLAQVDSTSKFPITFNLKLKVIFDHPSTELVTVVTFPPVTVSGLSTTLKQPAQAGEKTIVLNSVTNLAENKYISIGNPALETVEYRKIENLKDSTVTLNQPLSFDHPNPTPSTGAEVVLVERKPPTTPVLSYLLQSISAGQKQLMVADTGFAKDNIVEIGKEDSLTVEYKKLGDSINLKLIEIKDYTEDPPVGSVYDGLFYDHNHGGEVLTRSPLLRVQAIDRGEWGNSLQIEIEDDNSILETSASADPNPGSLQLNLASIVGIEVGSILQLEVSQPLTALPAKITFPNDLKSQIRYDESLKLLFFQGVMSELDKELLLKLASTSDPNYQPYQTAIEGLAQKSQTIYPFGRKVVSVNGKTVTLSAPHTVPIPQGTKARTKEFRLAVKYIQNNPLTGKLRLLGSEVHRHLSMDPRHSRYVTKVIGAIFRQELTTPRRADGRTEGESDLIRVEDVLADKTTGKLTGSNLADAENNIRIGPDLIWKILPDGRSIVVGIPLVNGDDKINEITDDTYKGSDAVDPNDRQGLFTLKNIDEISIVAIPGQTSQPIQAALIEHCELMRYRFAVIDADIRSNLANVQVQRGLYDSKYAAIYYPWLRIPDPFPDNPRITSYVSIPPSGHMIGIYARSDIERGVYKAPANEVIRGIADLEVKLMKEQQDILNPRNINVLRNFREDNRGLRVWGARTLSSDPDWKYINVRRLFIFIEKSIDRGTQWVVFEPNDEPLWQRVKRVITGFLTQVWRDGALMGRTPEEAFYVKCDRTTMTQNDIDNGRLIVLIGIAPVKPAEFVIFRIGQWAGGSSLEEG